MSVDGIAQDFDLEADPSPVPRSVPTTTPGTDTFWMPHTYWILRSDPEWGLAVEYKRFKFGNGGEIAWNWGLSDSDGEAIATSSSAKRVSFQPTAIAPVGDLKIAVVGQSTRGARTIVELWTLVPPTRITAQDPATGETVVSIGGGELASRERLIDEASNQWGLPTAIWPDYSSLGAEAFVAYGAPRGVWRLNLGTGAQVKQVAVPGDAGSAPVTSTLLGTKCVNRVRPCLGNHYYPDATQGYIYILRPAQYSWCGQRGGEFPVTVLHDADGDGFIEQAVDYATFLEFRAAIGDAYLFDNYWLLTPEPERYLEF